MNQFPTIEKSDRSINVSRFWHTIKELQFISSFFSWFFMLLSRLAEPCMLLAVLYVIIEAGIPQVATPTLHNLSVAVMIAAPEIILPGAFVIVKQAKAHGEETRPLLAICWLFVLLTLITLTSLFVLHLDHEAISILMCLRCGAGVGYSILVRMLSYRGLSLNQEQKQLHTQQPAQAVITPELLEELRTRLGRTTVSEEKNEQPLLLNQGEQLNRSEQRKPEHQKTNTRKMVKRENEHGANNRERVSAYIASHPHATVREVAEALQISVSTANKWMSKAAGNGEQGEHTN